MCGGEYEALGGVESELREAGRATEGKEAMNEYQRGLEAAAKIADLYAEENFRMASDTILIDPVLRGD